MAGSSIPSSYPVAPRTSVPIVSPRAATQSAGGGTLITTAAELAAFLTEGNATRSGVPVTPERSLADPTVFGCVRLITSAVGTMPLDIKRRIDDRRREDASDTRLWQLMRRRPNRWQKPHQFRRMLQAHVLLRGNAYCLIVRSRGEILELVPLHPDRVEPKQGADLRVEYHYRRPDGGLTIFQAREIFHLFGLSLDGIRGVTPLTYARETVGLSLAMAEHGASMFANGARVPGYLKHPGRLGPEAVAGIKSSLEEYRSGGEREGRELVLEEGMEYVQLGLTSVDAQWIESRRFSRTDLAMFYGVPPFLLGDTEKSTSWGTGLEQQKDGFVAFGLEDHLTMWEEGITIDLSEDPAIYARFVRSALVRGDTKARWEAYARQLQWGVRNPNEIRALEDENPREGGDRYYDPPNQAGGQTDSPETGNDPSQAA
jgi:HK97 family phage portal protein